MFFSGYTYAISVKGLNNLFMLIQQVRLCILDTESHLLGKKTTVLHNDIFISGFQLKAPIIIFDFDAL